MHKANILRLTDGLFLKIAEEVHSEFPEIEMDYMLVDSCALNLVKKPDIFDIIVTTNMFGDILSDEAAGLVGGLGVVASANIGPKHALFEPVHGAAFDIAGKNIASPQGLISAIKFVENIISQ